jgi:hypothetical protein
MAGSEAEKKLLDPLDRRAFEPVLRARPERFPEGRRKTLDHVQYATRAARERYNRYGSARKIYEMFKNGLNSDPAKRVHRERGGVMPNRLGLRRASLAS